MLKDLFKKTQYAIVKPIKDNVEEKPSVPSGLWIKCDKCGSIIYKEDLDYNYCVCNNCNNHLRINAKKRIKMIFDKNSFQEINSSLQTNNPIDFPGYNEKLISQKLKSDSHEAVITGVGKINGLTAAVAVMDSFFMMGSMGTVVGEKITRLVELAIEKRLPLIIFTTSGGARMQEGIFSLMQMAKISAAIGRLDKEGLLYISVLTNPTTGGVTASFAMQGDIILSEPDVLVGFAGRRVIENTINEKLPDNFQKAEFLLEKGFIDKIVERRNLKEELYNILRLHEVI